MDLAKKRDEFGFMFLRTPCGRVGGGTHGGSAHAHCLACLWQTQFSFQKGAKETGFHCKDFSALAELADNPREGQW